MAAADPLVAKRRQLTDGVVMQKVGQVFTNPRMVWLVWSDADSVDREGNATKTRRPIELRWASTTSAALSAHEKAKADAAGGGDAVDMSMFKARGRKALAEVDVVQPHSARCGNGDRRSTERRARTFALLSKEGTGRNCYFEAASLRERDEWVSVFQSVVAARGGVSGASGAGAASAAGFAASSSTRGTRGDAAHGVGDDGGGGASSSDAFGGATYASGAGALSLPTFGPLADEGYEASHSVNEVLPLLRWDALNLPTTVFGMLRLMQQGVPLRKRGKRGTSAAIVWFSFAFDQLMWMKSDSDVPAAPVARSGHVIPTAAITSVHPLRPQVSPSGLEGDEMPTVVHGLVVDSPVRSLELHCPTGRVRDWLSEAFMTIVRLVGSSDGVMQAFFFDLAEHSDPLPRRPVVQLDASAAASAGAGSRDGDEGGDD